MFTKLSPQCHTSPYITQKNTQPTQPQFSKVGKKLPTTSYYVNANKPTLLNELRYINRGSELPRYGNMNLITINSYFYANRMPLQNGAVKHVKIVKFTKHTVSLSCFRSFIHIYYENKNIIWIILVNILCTMAFGIRCVRLAIVGDIVSGLTSLLSVWF